MLPCFKAGEDVWIGKGGLLTKKLKVEKVVTIETGDEQETGLVFDVSDAEGIRWWATRKGAGFESDDTEGWGLWHGALHDGEAMASRLEAYIFLPEESALQAEKYAQGAVVLECIV